MLIIWLTLHKLVSAVSLDAVKEMGMELANKAADKAEQTPEGKLYGPLCRLDFLI